MPTDPTQTVVPQMARVWLAPVGTVAPDGPLAVMPTGWKDVGLFMPDSLTWATDPAFESATAHQSNYPIRRWQTSDAATLQVDLEQWNKTNFRAVFGGGTFTQITPAGAGSVPYFRFSPPAIGSRESVAACVEIIDGDNHLRRMIPRCEQTEGVEQSFNRTAISTLPLRLAVLGGDVGDPWYDMSDMEAMDPAA